MPLSRFDNRFAVRVRSNVADSFAQAFRRRKRTKNAAAINRQNAVFRSSPNRAFLVGKNSQKPIIDNAFRIALIKNCKTHAVKPRQPVKRRQPQITVRRLRHARNRILRQTVFRRPNVKPVFLRRNSGDNLEGNDER
ncbi:MAG: hypothetical protein M3Q78_00500 [Acidobacteriota bacterium]|nr:hypothetical protein [Acidobacteriota bacterium]